jgi:nucleotide-binding universal stress UspA family protein
MDASGLSRGHYRKILFCTDFSENAAFAFDFAVDAAVRNAGCTLILLHVVPEPDAQFWKGAVYEAGDLDARARAEIDRAVDAAYRPRVPAGVAFEAELRVGEASRVILDFAAAEGVDLIVLGRQGRGAITQWLLGNVATKVVRHCTCPALVIPLAFKERHPAAAAAGSPA